MTTAPDHHDPLDDEERYLAARLGRIGPFDGPSPALDAKILAAAHAAAVARTPSRRRLAWLGVPPALVTGMGVAAAAVLALGLVWQLRPQPGVVMSRGEADAGEEVILIAEPAGTARAPIVNPPPVPEEHAAAARPQPAAAPARAQDASKSAKAVDLPQSKAQAAAAGESAALAAQAASADEEKHEAERALRDAASEQGLVAEPPATAAPGTVHKRATYTTAARARAEQRERAAAANAASDAAAPASAPPEYDAAPASAAASAEAQTTLDRIEVTGSRISRDRYADWSRVPVSDDTHLGAAEWLERIRARRADDDTDNARASLRLFQREYPRVRLPDDLRELLADAQR